MLSRIPAQRLNGMSTWTSRSSRVALCSVGLVLACLAAAPVAFAADDPGVRVVPPRGFCISEGNVQQGLVLIGTCAAVQGGTDFGRAEPPAILTATVGPPGSAMPIEGQAEVLTGFFTSTAGRRALSRSGRADTVEILEAVVLPDRRFGPAFALHARDTAPFPGGRASADYWRALFPVGSQMVTLTVTGLVADPMDRDAGLALLREFVAAIYRANRQAVTLRQ